MHNCFRNLLSSGNEPTTRKCTPMLPMHTASCYYLNNIGSTLLAPVCTPVNVLGSLTCRFTEADLRLFPTIVRFDAVYAGLFKCGRKRVADLPNLQGWLRDVWQLTIPGSSLQVRAAASHLSLDVP